MKSSSSNWFNKPSKKQLFLIVTIWLISMTLLFIGNNNSIPSNMLLLLVIPSTIVVLYILNN